MVLCYKLDDLRKYIIMCEYDMVLFGWSKFIGMEDKV